MKVGLDKCLEVIGGDSTNSNTGWKGGAMTWLERMLERKCFWVICMIHTNELPLRHLIVSIDGKTSSKDGFTGPIGKLLSQVDDMERNYEFPPIEGLEELIDIPQDIVNSMSTDASICYQLVKAVTSGRLSERLAGMKCGKQCHSRWITTGEAILILWMCKHELTGDTLDTLKLLVTFLVQVYFPMFFKIKVKHSIQDGPYHVLSLLNLVRQQNAIVKHTVEPYIMCGAWFAHSEPVILSLVSSDDPEERNFGVKQILKIRGSEEYGETSPRARRTPTLNMEARNLMELIDWDNEVLHEPVFTCHLSKKEICAFEVAPFKPPYYPNHTQSVERAVKLVTEASKAVSGFQNRDGYIKSPMASRAIVPKFSSKKDIMAIF